MKKGFLILMSILCLGAMAVLPTRANEAAKEVEVSELNQLMVAQDAVAAKELPDDKAKTVISFESGASVLVIGETKDGWYEISYQGKEGYIRKSALSAQEIDAAGIDKEMEVSEAESRLVIEEVERYRAEARRSKIWGTIIVLLVVGIFATGIISTIKTEKEKRGEEVIDLDKEQ